MVVRLQPRRKQGTFGAYLGFCVILLQGGEGGGGGGGRKGEVPESPNLEPR